MSGDAARGADAVLELRHRPIQRRGIERFEAILAAARSVLADQGYEHFTIEDVATRAAVPVGSVYQYFPNKAAILVAMMHEERDLARRKARGWIEEGLDPDRALIRAQIEQFQGQMAEQGIAPGSPLALRLFS